MTTRATLKIAGLAALIAVGAGAGYAQSRTDSGTRGAMFDRIDANGDGQVTAEELRVRARTRFDATDTNGDGFIDADEMKAEAKTRGAARNRDRAAWMLERFDADSSGSLDAEELASMMAEGPGRGRWGGHRMRHHGKDHHRGEGHREGRRGGGFDRMLKRMDTNEDGKLSFDEVTARRDPARMIERLDSDGNGTISAEEFAQARRGKRDDDRKASE